MDKSNRDPDNIQEADEDEEHLQGENLQCRLYRKDFPEEGDLVIVS
jgi:hypothetical protein